MARAWSRRRGRNPEAESLYLGKPNEETGDTPPIFQGIVLFQGNSDISEFPIQLSDHEFSLFILKLTTLRGVCTS